MKLEMEIKLFVLFNSMYFLLHFDFVCFFFLLKQHHQKFQNFTKITPIKSKRKHITFFLFFFAVLTFTSCLICNNPMNYAQTIPNRA